MTLAELFLKWTARREEWGALSVSVSGAAIAEEVLSDITAASTAAGEVTVTPTEAAAATNYHPESIARLVRTGKVKNYGTKHRPRVRLSELPKKTAASREPSDIAQTGPSGASSRARAKNITPSSIARDAVAGRIGRS